MTIIFVDDADSVTTFSRNTLLFACLFVCFLYNVFIDKYIIFFHIFLIKWMDIQTYKKERTKEEVYKKQLIKIMQQREALLPMSVLLRHNGKANETKHFKSYNPFVYSVFRDPLIFIDEI